MCLATPGRVIKISGKKAIIKTDRHQHEVNLSLVKSIKIGDYLLAHADIAINKIPKDEALKILKMVKNGQLQ